VGNAVDRVRSAQGVVDWLDIGFGPYRWPTFNVADVAVSGGAFLLAWTLWGEEDAERASPGAAGAAVPAGSPEMP
jgi:signal peptidase II